MAALALLLQHVGWAGLLTCGPQAVLHWCLAAHSCTMSQDNVLNPAFDHEARDFVGEQYKNAGINVALQTTPTKIEKGGDGKMTVTCEPKDGEPYTISGLDIVMMATGRAPATKNIGLEEVRPCPDLSAHLDSSARQAAAKAGILSSAARRCRPALQSRQRT